MREILFRGKKDNGEWVKGFYFGMVHDDGSHAHHFIMPLGIDLGLETPIANIQIEVDPETVCQYTGLTDKNGRKIFEGDIVKDTDLQTIGKVFYWEYEGRFAFDDVNDDEQFYTGDMWEDCQVIGNIFDNPELIGD